AARRDVDVATLLERYQQRRDLVTRFVESYRHYCWPVETVKDLKLAPFHVLATEGTVHVDKDHLWHMRTLAEVAAQDCGLLIATPHRVVDLTDPASEAEATAWWEDLTERSGEGMVVKPLSFVAKGRKGLVQPAVKVRGREYLRIIYGPEYTQPANLERLRQRGLSVKALAGVARIRAGDRRAGAICAQRAVAAGARAGPPGGGAGEGAGASEGAGETGA